MRKILGTKDQYYNQTNNAQVELIKDYTGQKKFIACGPESLAMALDIAGWDMSVFTPGEQPGDSLLMVYHNPLNLKIFNQERKLDYDKWPPNEIPQLMGPVTELVFGERAAFFHSAGLNFQTIKDAINEGFPLVVSGNFPAGGHYVTVKGYDDDKGPQVIFNDPFPPQWPDNNGYNRHMSWEEFDTIVSPYYNLIVKPKKKTWLSLLKGFINEMV